MTLRIRHIDPDATPTSQVSLEALARIIPEATVAEVLKECDATEQRTRKLCASFVVILCVAMNLYTNDCISHVFLSLCSRGFAPSLWPNPKLSPRHFCSGCALWLLTALCSTCPTPQRTFESSANAPPRAGRVPGRRRGLLP